MVVSLASATVWAGETVSPAHVIVRLDDLAGIPAQDLNEAKSEVSRVFRAADVDVNWVDSSASRDAGQLTLILLKHNAQPSRETGDVAGQAIREASRAYVYCDKLETVTKHLPVDANVILGRVMAHEIGHLLLPPNSHSTVGIMRPHADLSQAGVTMFTHAQVQALRSAINGMPERP
jgi:hypothetical protein